MFFFEKHSQTNAPGKLLTWQRFVEAPIKHVTLNAHNSFLGNMIAEKQQIALLRSSNQIAEKQARC